jgi:hypothetical protein
VKGAGEGVESTKNENLEPGILHEDEKFIYLLL